MADTSFNGVNFSPAQQKILTDDLALIDNITTSIAGEDWTYNNLENQFQEVNGRLNDSGNYCGSSSFPNSKKYSDCINSLNAQWTEIRGKQDASNAHKAVLQSQLDLAKKNYNDDLAAIQDQIKFGIQATLTNSTASTQSAQNQVTLNQNDPRLLLQKAQADAAQKLKATELQVVLDKQKRDQQVNLVGFVLITLVVLGIGFYIYKKIF